MLLHLIPIGRARFELYGEPPEVDEGPLAHDAGRVRRWLHTAGDHWRQYVDAARMGSATGRLARWRDAVICKLADSLDEQRTLRWLRTATSATVFYPAGGDEAAARAELDRLLATSRRHHGQWLIVYLLLFICSGVLFFIPGPNIVAYYLGFQAFGHLQSWRGARQGLSACAWTLRASEELTELARLAELPHNLRMARVDELAARLDLPHLPAFFERASR